LKDYIKQQEQMEYSTAQKYIDDPDYAGKVIENEIIFDLCNWFMRLYHPR